MDKMDARKLPNAVLKEKGAGWCSFAKHIAEGHAKPAWLKLSECLSLNQTQARSVAYM